MVVKFGRSPAHEGAAQLPLPDRLLRAPTPQAVVEAWFEADPQLDTHGACVLWSTHWPRDIEAFPPACADAKVIADAIDAVSRIRAGENDDSHPRVLYDDGEGAVAVLNSPHADDRPVPRLGRAPGRNPRPAPHARKRRAPGAGREAAALALRDRRHGRLRPRDAGHAARPASHRRRPDVRGEFLHRAVRPRSRLRCASSTSPTWSTTRSSTPEEEIPLARIERGLTWYLIRDKRPLMGSTRGPDAAGVRPAAPARRGQHRLAGRADDARRRRPRRGGRAELHRRALLHDGGDVAAGVRRRAHPHRAGTQERPRRTGTPRRRAHAAAAGRQQRVAPRSRRTRTRRTPAGRAVPHRRAGEPRRDAARTSIATCTRSSAS